MPELIKEERYLFFVGTKEHVLRVQELLWGLPAWPERFRIHVHASYRREAKNFYGTTAREAVERAIEYLSSEVREAGPSPFAHCALCHGNDLKGNGPFPPPYRVPPDLTTLSRRHGGKFPEAYVSSVLRNGVTMPAHGPAEMPVWATTNRLDKSHIESRIRDLTNYLKSRQAK